MLHVIEVNREDGAASFFRRINVISQIVNS
jgi:hypothetical protein